MVIMSTLNRVSLVSAGLKFWFFISGSYRSLRKFIVMKEFRFKKRLTEEKDRRKFRNCIMYFGFVPIASLEMTNSNTLCLSKAIR